MVKRTIISAIVIGAFVLIQTTLLSKITIFGVTPDIAMIILVCISIRNGSMVGQISGFATGILEDLLSLSPLGFHCFIKTATGFLFGLFRGSVFIDPVLIPLLIGVIATVFKGLVASFLSIFIKFPGTIYDIFSVKLWIEVGFNAVLSPFIFALLGLFKIFKTNPKEEI